MAESLVNALKQMTIGQKWKLAAAVVLLVIVGYDFGRNKHALPAPETETQKRADALGVAVDELRLNLKRAERKLESARQEVAFVKILNDLRSGDDTAFQRMRDFLCRSNFYPDHSNERMNSGMPFVLRRPWIAKDNPNSFFRSPDPDWKPPTYPWRYVHFAADPDVQDYELPEGFRGEAASLGPCKEVLPAP